MEAWVTGDHELRDSCLRINIRHFRLNERLNVLQIKRRAFKRMAN